MIHAETFEALLDLRWQQDTLRLSREYLVLVHGDFTEPVAGGVRDVRCLEDRLLEVPGGTRVAPNGRPCRCSVRPLARLQAEGKGKEGGEGEKKGKATVPFTLVAVSILTGRRHQIRVQLASRGHPVVGDPRYGNAADLGWCPRLFLHRHRLVFNEGVSVDDPLPADLRAVIANLQPCIELEELEGILAAPPTFDSDEKVAGDRVAAQLAAHASKLARLGRIIQGLRRASVSKAGAADLCPAQIGASALYRSDRLA